MPATLNSLIDAINADPGLRSQNPAAQIVKGLDAARELNTILLRVIDRTNVNDDGRLSISDLYRISAETRGNPADYADFLQAHGNDHGSAASGFHYVQDDGGSLMFQSRPFIDTVVDGIYHFGFGIQNGRFFNEDGYANETVLLVAGWLNYFLNGENIVYGTGADDVLSRGSYSNYFAAARNETFLAGDGNDQIWADVGNDKVMAGNGRDQVGGGTGNDRIYGEAGADSLWGDPGNDRVYGGAGNDVMEGGDGTDLLDGGAASDNLMGDAGNDTVIGNLGADLLYGGASADRIEGGEGNDSMLGGTGNDLIIGNQGDDGVLGGEGSDQMRGGSGADDFLLWEDVQVADTLHFAAGDSGKTLATIDHVEGFDSGVDKIDLSDFGPMTFRGLDYRGGGRASCYYDGLYLRIDRNGDAATDMMIEFAHLSGLRADDFVFA